MILAIHKVVKKKRQGTNESPWQNCNSNFFEKKKYFSQTYSKKKSKKTYEKFSSIFNLLFVGFLNNKI